MFMIIDGDVYAKSDKWEENKSLWKRYPAWLGLNYGPCRSICDTALKVKDIVSSMKEFTLKFESMIKALFNNPVNFYGLCSSEL